MGGSWRRRVWGSGVAQAGGWAALFVQQETMGSMCTCQRRAPALSSEWRHGQRVGGLGWGGVCTQQAKVAAHRSCAGMLGSACGRWAAEHADENGSCWVRGKIKNRQQPTEQQQQQWRRRLNGSGGTHPHPTASRCASLQQLLAATRDAARQPTLTDVSPPRKCMFSQQVRLRPALQAPPRPQGAPSSPIAVRGHSLTSTLARTLRRVSRHKCGVVSRAGTAGADCRASASSSMCPTPC